VRYQFMKEHEHEHRVTVMCRVLQVSKSGYYDWRRRPESPRSRENCRLLVRIQAIHVRSREAYGTVKTQRALREEGLDCGRHRIARLRQVGGIVARRVRRFRLAYAARNSEPAAPNLLDRNFTMHARPTGSGSVISPSSRRVRAGSIWPSCLISTRAGWLAGR
jgi:putative transposase